MTQIKNEQQYNATMVRIDELLPLVDNNTPLEDKNLIELDLLSGLAADYEEINYPIGVPDLVEVIKLRMFEMGLNQQGLAKLLGVSKSRISDYLNGRSEPTLNVARSISQELSIDADIVLGVSKSCRGKTTAKKTALKKKVAAKKPTV